MLFSYLPTLYKSKIYKEGEGKKAVCAPFFPSPSL